MRIEATGATSRSPLFFVPALRQAGGAGFRFVVRADFMPRRGSGVVGVPMGVEDVGVPMGVEDIEDSYQFADPGGLPGRAGFAPLEDSERVQIAHGLPQFLAGGLPQCNDNLLMRGVICLIMIHSRSLSLGWKTPRRRQGRRRGDRRRTAGGALSRAPEALVKPLTTPGRHAPLRKNAVRSMAGGSAARENLCPPRSGDLSNKAQVTPLCLPETIAMSRGARCARWNGAVVRRRPVTSAGTPADVVSNQSMLSCMAALCGGIPEHSNCPGMEGRCG